jgi:hypothetical protein
MQLEDFVSFVLWDPCPPTGIACSFLLGFPISIVNNPHSMTKSSFDKSLRKLIKWLFKACALFQKFHHVFNIS